MGSIIGRMLKRLRYAFASLLRIRPEDNVAPEVARHFKHNVLVNTLDITAFFGGEAYISVNTIMPVFAATLTDNPVIIGLIPALVNAGWYIPQLFMASKVSRLERKLPFTMRMSAMERVPHLFFPFLALAIPRIGAQTALVFLVILMAWRGLAAGLTALPWQEVTARAIPLSHRSRFWGISRVSGQIVGILSSVVAAFVLNHFAYPNNYAIGFSIAVVFLLGSWFAFSRNIEPMPNPSPLLLPGSLRTQEPNFSLAGKILREDANFRRYLVARIVAFFGNMGTGYLAVYGLRRFSLPDGQAAIFTGLLYAASIMGYALWGYLGDRVGPRRILVTSFMIWATALAIAILAPSIWVYYLVFLAYGFYVSGSVMSDAILVLELGSDELRPTYMGLARTLASPGLLLAPFIAGMIVEASSYPVMFAVSAALALAAAWLMNRVHDRPRGRVPGEQAGE